jgi:pilus assembly protein CpaB
VLRRILAAACATGAVWLVLAEVRPPPPVTVQVVVAAVAVPAGSVLGTADVTVVSVPEAGLQPGALTAAEDAVGRRTAAELAVGEAITRTRLVPRTEADGLPPGRVALHVVLADPVAADVVGAGDAVIVFPARGGEPLARHGVVLVPDPPAAAVGPGLGSDAARGVVLALPPQEAERVLSAHGGLEGPVVVNLVASGRS